MRVFLTFLAAMLLVVVGVCADAPQPASITEKCDAGLTAFRNKEYAKAAAQFDSILSSITAEQQVQYKKTIADIQYHLALCYFQLGQYDAAMTNFSAYMATAPDGAYAEQSGFGVSASQFELEQYKESGTSYEALVNKFPMSKMKVEYLMSLAVCWFEIEDTRARTLFERVIKSTPDRERQLQCMRYIMERTAEKADVKEASSILKSLVGTPPKLDALTYLAPFIVKVADRLYEAEMPDDALAWYHLVLPRKTVLDMYQSRLARLKRDLSYGKKYSPTASTTLALEREVPKFAATVKAFMEAPDYTPGIWCRLARVYFDRGEQYESRLLYDAIVKKFPSSDEAPAALFGNILCNADLGRHAHALELADEFLARYTNSSLRDRVGYVGGEMMVKLGQMSNAIVRFTQELTANPNSPYAERMRLLIGNAHFVIEEFDAARTAYQAVLAAFPQGDYAEEATYRSAVVLLYKNDATNGLAEFEAFRTRFPASAFNDDASYRIGEIKYQSADYRGALGDIDGFTTKYPETQLGKEALMLAADCHLGLMGEATTAVDFAASLSNAVDRFRQLQETTKGVDPKRWRYAVLQEGICHRYAEDYARVVEYFSQVLNDYAGDPVAGDALGELADAYHRLGQTDKANESYHQAIQVSGEDATNDVADKCLAQYAQVLMRDSRSNEFVTHLEQWRDGLPQGSLLRARIDGTMLDLFEQSGDGAGISQQLDRITTMYAATNMPAPLAVRLADRALKDGDTATARRLYQGIVDGSAVGQPYSRARLGLAWLELESGNYPEAKAAYTELQRFVGDQTLMPAIMYGNGAVALAVSNTVMARTYFDSLVANREWRGEYTAAALYGLGECERLAGKEDSAHSYYQRIYVLYGAYRQWVAKAYVAAGMCLERLGKKEDASGTFAEMLSNPELQVFDDEVRIARAHADKLPPPPKRRQPATETATE